MFFICLLLIISVCCGYKAPQIFTLERENLLKALFPFGIILGHISFGTNDTILTDWRWTGPYLVGIFFFMSGYGLEYKFLNGKLTFSSLRIRLIKLLIPILIPLFLYLIIVYFNKGDIFNLCITELGRFTCILPCTWFVIVLGCMYILYYFLRIKTNNIFHFVCLFVVSLLGLFLFFYIYGLDGTYYESNSAFLLGVLYKDYEMKVNKFIIGGGKKLIAILFLLMLAIGISYINHKPIVRGFAMIGVPIYVLAFMILYSNNNTPQNNIVVQYFKKISYEVYLCQGIVFLLLHDYIDKVWLYTLYVFITDILLASVCHYFTSKIVNLFFNRK